MGAPRSQRKPVTFEQYARRRLPAMLATARAICADDGVAEDLVQDVLIKLHAHWESISVMDAPDAYVRRMLVNDYLSWRRKWARLLPFADVAWHIREADSAKDDVTSVHADRDVLLAEVRRLPPRQRAVIGLRYFADLGDGEIADLLGCRPSTVRVHVARALKALRVTYPQPSSATNERGAS